LPKKEDIVENITERRSVKRFLFPGDTEVTASLSIRDQEDAIVISDILNLSEDGLGFSFKIDPNSLFKKGDRFIIKEISGLSSADFLLGVEMEIKWLLRYNPQRGARCGCEFARKSEVLKKNIRRFIDVKMTQSLIVADGLK
jgi:hypothetical protein